MDQYSQNLEYKLQYILSTVINQKSKYGSSNRINIYDRSIWTRKYKKERNG